MLDGEMSEFLDAAPNERTEGHSGYRSYHRGLVTRIGKLELRVPRSSTPCAWNTDLATSIPIVVIFMADAPPFRVVDQRFYSGTSMPTLLGASILLIQGVDLATRDNINANINANIAIKVS